jgi:translation initiation factor 5B
VTSLLRAPILSLLGHVDHGKTSLLDRIAGSVHAAHEAGGITQHIGAVEIPGSTVMELCQGMLASGQMKVPGLLIIDTPGHRSFETMRRRGGALADLAILVVDSREGVMPQTRESLQILKHEKTPFAVALTKIDLLDGWHKPANPIPLADAIRQSNPEFSRLLDEKVYTAAESLIEFGFSADRFDRVSDFTRNVGIVPVSSKAGVGVGELLSLLVGLSQRFLSTDLARIEGRAEGTILERSDEKGIGPVAAVILYQGTLHVGDEIVATGRGEPMVTRVRGIYRPPPARHAKVRGRGRLISAEEVPAAAGVYVAAPGIERAIPGGLLKAVGTLAEKEEARRLLVEDAKPPVEMAESGVQILADTLGGLEALAFECGQAGIPVHGADVGPVNRAMVLTIADVRDPLHRAILAFNVPVLPDAQPEGPSSSVQIFEGEVMYRILEQYHTWKGTRETELTTQRREDFLHPAKLKVLPGFVFRTSKPAIVGVRVLAGRLRPGIRLMRLDGTEVGLLKALQQEGKSQKEATEGAEVAASIDGAVVGRTIKEDDVLYVSLSESAVRSLKGLPLTSSEKMTLDELLRIQRRINGPLWGQ